LVYNEQLASKIRALVARRKGWTEKKMFGGVAFIYNGKMCCGVIKDDLLVRVGPEQNDKALALPNSRPMDFTGKPMKGFIYVDSKGWSKEASLKKWVDMGIDYVSLLLNK
jgi:TfoX/Sxy family transcriptional regulator of competence genes